MTDFFVMRSGETAAPLPPGPVLCSGTADMRRIHRFFLWAYQEAPGLVRSAKPGDTDRAAEVGEVLSAFDTGLRVHHEGEDLLMYPKLTERAPACALHVGQMLGQHKQVAQMLDAIEPVRSRWIATADADASGELVRQYEDLSEVLQTHLRREVTEVMPAVDRVLTDTELTEVGQHGIDTLDRKLLLSYLGFILASNPAEDRKELFKEMPAPVRVMYRVVGRRMYRRKYAQLFPGRVVPATL